MAALLDRNDRAYRGMSSWLDSLADSIRGNKPPPTQQPTQQQQHDRDDRFWSGVSSWANSIFGPEKPAEPPPIHYRYHFSMDECLARYNYTSDTRFKQRECARQERAARGDVVLDDATLSFGDGAFIEDAGHILEAERGGWWMMDGLGMALDWSGIPVVGGAYYMATLRPGRAADSLKDTTPLIGALVGLGQAGVNVAQAADAWLFGASDEEIASHFRDAMKNLNDSKENVLTTTPVVSTGTYSWREADALRAMKAAEARGDWEEARRQHAKAVEAGINLAFSLMDIVELGAALKPRIGKGGKGAKAAKAEGDPNPNPARADGDPNPNPARADPDPNPARADRNPARADTDPNPNPARANPNPANPNPKRRAGGAGADNIDSFDPTNLIHLSRHRGSVVPGSTNRRRRPARDGHEMGESRGRNRGRPLRDPAEPDAGRQTMANHVDDLHSSTSQRKPDGTGRRTIPDAAETRPNRLRRPPRKPKEFCHSTVCNYYRNEIVGSLLVESALKVCAGLNGEDCLAALLQLGVEDPIDVQPDKKEPQVPERHTTDRKRVPASVRKVQSRLRAQEELPVTLFLANATVYVLFFGGVYYLYRRLSN